MFKRDYKMRDEGQSSKRARLKGEGNQHLSLQLLCPLCL